MNKIIIFLIVFFSISNTYGQCNADFYWEIPSSCTTYDTVKFYDNSSNATVWFWDFGDSTTSNIQSPIHHYNNLGIYIATLIISDGASCSDTISIPVVVSSCLTDFSYIPIDNNNKIQFFDKPNFSYIPANYIWDFGDSTFSYQRLPTHTYNQEGLYNIKLTVYDSSNYCYQELIKEVRISQPINVSISISDGDWTNPYTWLDSIIPNNNDSVIICSNVNLNTDISLLSPGMLYVNKNASLCGHQTYSGKLITYGDLNLDYVDIKDTSYSDFIPINCLNGFSISSGTYMTQYYPTSYNFSCLSVIENKNLDFIEIYPNPAKEFVYINVYNNELSKISIINIFGKIIKTKTFYKTIKIKTNELEKGIYIFKIVTNNEIITKKIIIE